MTVCTHLDHVHITELPESVAGCEDCLLQGTHGCICGSASNRQGRLFDDSPNRHANATLEAPATR